MWRRDRIVINVGTSIYYVKGVRFRVYSYRKWNPVLISISHKKNKMRFGRGVQICLYNFMIQLAIIDYERPLWT